MSDGVRWCQTVTLCQTVPNRVFNRPRGSEQLKNEGLEVTFAP